MNSSIHSEFHGNPDKARDRHFVTWSEEEDNILREQVRIHGTERWSVIASHLGNKTGRQCRRRWNTYLSTPYKKGGWSPEEDNILFEAHKKFGNRWTEIAKVVQGRTDNAVKNRFNALHRKLEKRKSCKENNDDVSINVNKRVALESSVETLDSTIFCKKMRNQFVNFSEKMTLQREERVIRTKNTLGTFQGDAAIKPGIQDGEPDSICQSRVPLSVLSHENLTNLRQSAFPAHSSPYHAFSAIKRPIHQAAVSKLQGNFLEKDDPKLSALTQQAELLGSLAKRRIAETSNQETENAWKATNGILIEGKDSLLIAENQRKDQSPNFNPTANGSTPYLSSKEKYQNATHLPSKRLHIPSLPKLCEPCENVPEKSPEFSVGSNLDDTPKCNILQTESSDFVCEDKSLQTCSTNTEGKEQVSSSSDDCSTAVQYALSSKTTEEKDERVVPITSEYCSPTQVIPYLRSFVDEIPSPHFSESERQFILSVLDPESEMPSLAYRSLSPRGL
ncbi:hypothetical protein SUGI_1078370 [Cryptomeria japonica]|nr:hypothetical protein SUGI_1078370 [Cryptomeria japonica]